MKIKYNQLVVRFLIFLGFVSLFLTSTNTVKACCKNKDCNAQETCEGAGTICPQQGGVGSTGACTFGGTECGGAGNGCPGDLTCSHGNCICTTASCVTPINNRTCFAAGTKVDLEGSTKRNIEDVKVGDRVVSQDEQGNRSVSTVTKLDQPIREHMCRVDFADGDVLNMTVEHPIMTKEGWKSITPSKTAEENPDLIVSSLQKDDEVVRDDGGYGKVQDISCWSAKTPAYNLILDEGAHTYFADGYLAHNKTFDRPPIACAVGKTGTCSTPKFPTIETYRKIANPSGFMCADDPYYDSWILDGRQTRDVWRNDIQANVPYDYCNINCGCCSAGSTWQCVAGAYYTYTMTAASSQCPFPDANAGNIVPNPLYTPTNGKPYGTRRCLEETCGCTALCTNAAPSAPVLTNPVNPPTPATISTLSITLQWSTPTSWGTACTGSVKNYNVYVWQVGAGVPPSPTYPSITATQKSVSGLERGVTYRWKVEADNGQLKTSSAIGEFKVLPAGQVSGTVYYDATNNCSKGLWNKGAGMTVQFRSTAITTNVSGTTGAWSLTTPTLGAYNVDLLNIPANYKISTATGCIASTKWVNLTSANPTNSPLDFYVTDDNLADAAWWQTVGAGVYVEGNIRSLLPDSSLYLILAPTGGTAAALFQPTGTTDLGIGSVSEPKWIAKSKTVKEMKYQDFANAMGVSSTQTSDWLVGDEITLDYPVGHDFGYKKEMLPFHNNQWMH